MGDMLDALRLASANEPPALSPALMGYSQPPVIHMQETFPPTVDIVMDEIALASHSNLSKAASFGAISSTGVNPSPTSSADSSSDVSTTRTKSSYPKSKTVQRGKSPSDSKHSSTTPTPKAKRPRVSENEKEPSKRAKTGPSTRTVGDSLDSQQSSSSNRASNKYEPSSSKHSKSSTAPSRSTTPTRTKAASGAKTPSASRKVEKKLATSPTSDHSSNALAPQIGHSSAVSTQATLKGKGRMTAMRTKQLHGTEFPLWAVKAAAECTETFGLPALRASKQMCLDGVYEA